MGKEFSAVSRDAVRKSRTLLLIFERLCLNFIHNHQGRLARTKVLHYILRAGAAACGSARA